jgi:hypothetical protein
MLAPESFSRKVSAARTPAEPAPMITKFMVIHLFMHPVWMRSSQAPVRARTIACKDVAADPTSPLKV